MVHKLKNAAYALAIIYLTTIASAQVINSVTMTSPAPPLTAGNSYVITVQYTCTALTGYLLTNQEFRYNTGSGWSAPQSFGPACDCALGCAPQYLPVTIPAGAAGGTLQINIAGDFPLIHVGQTSQPYPIVAGGATCNNNFVCDATETVASCPSDCPTPICPDGRCNGAETAASCPADCVVGTCVVDGFCDPATETPGSCPLDCAAAGACNNDFICDILTETAASCPSDCPTPYCGDGRCNAAETTASCPGDCPNVGYCGDGTCNGAETSLTCPGDCPIAPTVCGDGLCNGAETSVTCALDCPVGPGGGGNTINDCGIEEWWEYPLGVPVFMGWQVELDGGTPPYIYVWQCDVNQNNYVEIGDLLTTDYDLWYEWRLPKEVVAASGCQYVFVKVSDNRTDTQILEKELIYPELTSIASAVSTTCPDVTTIPDHLSSGTYFYGEPVVPHPYRSTNPADLGHWRLFEHDTVWTKILGITPLLVDTRYGQEWTRTSPNGVGDSDANSIKLMAYVVGGCQRTSASVLGGNGGFPYVPVPGLLGRPNSAQYYMHDDGTAGIYDSFTINITDGVNPPTSETIYLQIGGSSGVPLRSMLPFPPADSIGWIPGSPWLPYPNLLHFHPYEGARYSSLIYSFTLPDNAEYLRISVEYNCYDRYLRWYWNPAGLWTSCTIDDSSSVWTSYVVPPGQISKADLSEVEMKVSGYYDVTPNPLTGADEVTGGYIHLEVSPDELAGVLLHVDHGTAEMVPASKFQHLLYPVRHRLLKKWKPVNIGAAPQKLFYADDKYGFESTEFGYDGRCDLPACKGNCVCSPNDPLNPTCTDTTNPASPVSYKPNEDAVIDNDCRCQAADSCVLDVCNPPNSSQRTYHEFEESYYDFTEFYAKELKPPENYLSHYPDMASEKSITIDRVESNVKGSMLKAPASGLSWSTTFLETVGRPYRSETHIFRIIWPKFTITFYGGGMDGLEAQATLNGRLLATTPEFGGYYGPMPSVTKDVTSAGVMGDNMYHVYSDDSAGSQDAALQTVLEVKYEDINRNDIIQDFYFSAVNIDEGEFQDYANFSVYTHFRRKDFMVGQNNLLVRREDCEISWTATGGSYSLSGVGDAASPPTGTLHAGDEITVSFNLNCGGSASSSQDVEVNVPGYENGLTGVWWDNEGRAFVTASSGSGQFRFTLGNAPASVSMDYEGGYDKTAGEGYLPATASFVLGITEVNSPFASVEFFLLILIAFLLLFFWRWFRRGRTDYEGMMQELQGEASE